MRSLLLVAADSDGRLADTLAAGADAIVVDLANTASAGSATHRKRAADFIGNYRDRTRLFVRLNPLASPLLVGDLDAVVPARPVGVVLPAASGGAAVRRLSAMLRPREAIAGIDDGAIAILAVAADTAVGLFGLGSYGGASRRLVGLSWDAGAFAAAVGANGGPGLSDAERLARALILAGAAAAGVAAIDTPSPDAADLAGLERDAHQAHGDGFAGKFAVTPEQVAVINREFA